MQGMSHFAMPGDLLCTGVLKGVKFSLTKVPEKSDLF